MSSLRRTQLRAFGVWLLLALTISFCSPVRSTGDRPVHIHLTWQHDPASSVTVTWETAADVVGSSVRYGSNRRYGQVASGLSKTQGTGGRIHIVELTGLQPDAAYHYSCGDDAGGWSFDAAFTTAPAAARGFVFLAAADSRDNPAEWQKLVSRMQIVHPAFTLFSGDLVGSGNDSKGYDLWLQTWEPLGRVSAIAPAIGNHEDDGAIYYQRFPLPAPAKWYAFTYGAVRFIALNSEDPYTAGSQQYEWLSGELQAAAANAGLVWKILFLHAPTYAAGGHTPDPALQAALVPLIDQYGVDLVINGHCHYYERTFPLRGGADPSQPVITDPSQNYYSKPQGAIYVISGGAGAPLAATTASPLMACSLSAFNFVKITVSAGRELKLDAFRDDGVTLIDSFTIAK